MAVWRKKLYLGKTSRRFILSFLSVLILPMMCFIIFFQQNFRNIYSERIISQAQNNLNIIGSDLERRMEGLHTLVEYNAIDKKLQRAVRQGEKGVTTISDTLLATIASYPFLDDAYYYNQMNPKTIYSSAGTYTTYYYARLRGGMEDEEQLLEQLLQIRWAEWSVMGTNLVYVVKDGNAAWWIFQLDIQEVKKLLLSHNAITELWDSEGNALCQAGSVDMADHYVLEYSSSQNGFELYRRIDEAYLFGELDAWQRYFILMVILILLAGGILVSVLTYYNEKPMRRLLDYSRRKVPDLPADVDVLEAFQFMLESMEERAAHKSARQERDYLLLKLIYGQDCNTDGFLKSVKAAALFEKAQCYRVVLITSRGDQDINFHKIELYLNVQEKAGYEFHLADLHSMDATVIIVGMSDAADPGLKSELILMAETIAENMDVSLRFFVGEKGNRLADIHRSYAQAYACRQKEGESEAIVSFYKSPDNVKKGYQYPKAELGILYDALIEADLKKSYAVTDALITILTAENENKFVHAALYYDILNTYYRALVKLKKDEELNLAEADLLVRKDSADAVSMICRIRDQYREFVEIENGREQKAEELGSDSGGGNNGSAKAERNVAQNGDAEDAAQLIGRVVAYIDEHIQSGDLNVSSVADMFGMSISHMSHKFKDQTGKNISDYITEKKFAYACQLLKNTELSVKEITVITGYSHPYSFGRKFKQLYGMTPGEYREEQRGARS